LMKRRRKRRRHEAGLLVTLRELDPEIPLERMKNMVTLAYHNDIACALDGVCMRIVDPKANQRNILAVLEHEGLHHTFLRIGEDRANCELDGFMPTLQHTCRILGCTNHQIGVSA
jgi:hypothetical protein